MIDDSHLFQILFRLNRFVLSTANWRRRSDDSALVAWHLALSQQLTSLRLFFFAACIAFTLRGDLGKLLSVNVQLVAFTTLNRETFRAFSHCNKLKGFISNTEVSYESLDNTGSDISSIELSLKWTSVKLKANKPTLYKHKTKLSCITISTLVSKWVLCFQL